MKHLQELQGYKDIIGYLYVDEEFSKLNIDLTEEQLDDFVEQLKSGSDFLTLDLSTDQMAKAKCESEEDVLIEIIKHLKDSDSINKFLELMENDDGNKVAKLADRFAKDRLDSIYQETPQYFYDQRERHNKVVENVDDIWGNALDIFELLLVTIQEIGENFDVTKLNNFQDNVDLYDAMRRLHGRSSLIGYEILTLLRFGFADGAYARFRTLYETEVISNFIFDKGNEAAKRYLDYSIINDVKEAKLINQFSPEIDNIPISQDEIDELERKKKLLIEEYGKDFAKGDYGWASSFINKKRITFRDIEEAVGSSYMRPHYKSASGNIHTGSSSLYYHIAFPSEDTNKILTGASGYGIDVPCRLASGHLVMITTNLLSNQTQSLEQIIYMRLLDRLKREIHDAIDSISLASRNMYD